MGLNSPKSFTSTDGAVEKPKTLRAYIEAIKVQLERNEKLELKDEFDRLNSFVELKGVEILDQPIGIAISDFEKLIEENENEYKEKFGEVKISVSGGTDMDAEAGDLTRA